MAAENQVSDLNAEMDDLLGLPLDTELELAEAGTSPGERLTREQYLTAAVNRNPELQAAKETVSKARSALMAAQYEYIPNIGAFARETYQSGVPFLTHNFGTFGLQMTWNVFDWGKRKGVVGERAAQLTQAEENLRRITDRVTVDVEKAYRKLERTQMMVDVAQEAVALRKEADRISADQLKAGLTSDAKKAEAVAATRGAEVDELQARLSYELALAEIARLTGWAGR
jgi:outer membrane protein TolC